MLFATAIRSDHKGETPLDTQPEADCEHDENKVVPSTLSSSNQDDSNRKHLESDK